MIYVLLAWYYTALWGIWRFATDRSELIAASIAAILGPFIFPVIFVGRIIVSEKQKWAISNWYRDNYPPRKYTIIAADEAP